MKEILVKQGEKGKLAELFDVSYPTVRDALSGKRTSKVGIKIRKAAIERGGLEIGVVNGRGSDAEKRI